MCINILLLRNDDILYNRECFMDFMCDSSEVSSFLFTKHTCELFNCIYLLLEVCDTDN